MKNLYMELAETEAEERIEKRVKPNPTIDREMNLLPSKTKMMIEEPPVQNIPTFSQPVQLSVFFLL